MTWAAVWELARWVLPVAGAAVLWWVRDRRKDRAAATVAERTVDPEVELKETGAAEARLVYVQREMDLERAFHREQIAERDRAIEWRDAELARRDDMIARLVAQVTDLENQLAGVSQQLTAVRSQLNELADHHSPEERRT